MTLENYNDRIAAVLATSREAGWEESPASWQLQTPGIAREIRLRIADEWLLYEAALDGPAANAGSGDPFLPAQLMRWNATLPGGAKFGLDAQFNLTVRAEAALIEDTDPGPRLLEGRIGVEAGITRFYAGQEPAEPAPAPGVTPAFDLKALAAETSWAFTERNNGAIAFELPSREPGSTSAELHATVHGAVRVWVPLASLDTLTEAAQRALAVLLLRAGWVLRLARPAFAADNGQNSACLEVVFDSAPVGAELTAALESLAVGVMLAAKEATLLCQEQTARDYLAVGAWIPREQGDNNNNNNQK